MSTVLRWPVVEPDLTCIHSMKRRAVHMPGDTPTYLVECRDCAGTFAAIIESPGQTVF